MKVLFNLRAACIIILLAFFSMPLIAQDPPGRGDGRGQGPGRGQWGGQFTEENVKQRVENLAKTLECTDQQKEQILQYELEWYRKMQTERQKFAGGGQDFDREAFRASMEEQRKLRDEKYEEVLTDTQMKKYNQLMEERRQARQQQWQQREEGDGQNAPRQRGRGGS
jgi:Spy/CpxP family protein refolding chaperone